jgi:hypothetical protein
VASALLVEILKKQQTPTLGGNCEVHEGEFSSSSALVSEIEQECHLSVIWRLFATAKLAVVMQSIARLHTIIIELPIE